MRNNKALWWTLAGLLILAPGAASIGVQAQDKPAQEKPQVKIPEAGVPQIMTLEGSFVRAA